MIHELRVYEAVPGRLPALLKRFETDTLRLMARHGFSPVGFWTTVIGESSQNLHYILAWASLAEREQKMGAFGRDPEWAQVKDKTEAGGQLVAKITNTILSPTVFSPMK